MNYNINKNLMDENTSLRFIDLYKKYENELIEVTAEADIYRQNKTIMLPYRTTEMLYLAVRDRKPKNIIEFSPHDGWSTFWMLKALQKNGEGVLHTYDLIPNVQNNLPYFIEKGYLKFYQGDVRENLSDELINECSFFYIDTEHVEEIAKWYEQKILRKKIGTNSFFGIDDIFHHDEIARNSEAEYVVGYLNNNLIKFCNFDKYEFEKNYDLLSTVKNNLKKGQDSECGGNLTTIFFTL